MSLRQASAESVHSVGRNSDHQLERTCELNFDELDRRLAGIDEEPEWSVSMSDASSAILTGSLCNGSNPFEAATRFPG